MERWEKGALAEGHWSETFKAYVRTYPDLAAEFDRRMRGELPGDFKRRASDQLQRLLDKQETIASRKASQNAIQALAPGLPELIGGSADLASSNLTMWREAKAVSRSSGGNYDCYGVREFGMAAIMSGLTIHGACALSAARSLSLIHISEPTRPY